MSVNEKLIPIYRSLGVGVKGGLKITEENLIELSKEYGVDISFTGVCEKSEDFSHSTYVAFSINIGGKTFYADFLELFIGMKFKFNKKLECLPYQLDSNGNLENSIDCWEYLPEDILVEITDLYKEYPNGGIKAGNMIRFKPVESMGSEFLLFWNDFNHNTTLILR